jgi:hypothetical protein
MCTGFSDSIIYNNISFAIVFFIFFFLCPKKKKKKKKKKKVQIKRWKSEKENIILIKNAACGIPIEREDTIESENKIRKRGDTSERGDKSERGNKTKEDTTTSFAIFLILGGRNN